MSTCRARGDKRDRPRFPNNCFPCRYGKLATTLEPISGKRVKTLVCEWKTSKDKDGGSVALQQGLKRGAPFTSSFFSFAVVRRGRDARRETRWARHRMATCLK